MFTQSICSLIAVLAVELVAAIRGGIDALKNGQITNIDDLDYWFKNCLETVAWRLAEISKEQGVHSAVSEFWEKFQNNRPELESTHHALINKLIDVARKD